VVVAEPFRIIGFQDLRDAMENLLTVDLTDDELRERGVTLTKYETLINGLGPSSYALIELTTKEQYLLHRLQHQPEVLNVVASLDEAPTPLIDRFVIALDVPRNRIEWTASDEYWSDTRRLYDREKWLHRRRLG
jgi:hypothetical protein